MVFTSRLLLSSLRCNKKIHKKYLHLIEFLLYLLKSIKNEYAIIKNQSQAKIKRIVLKLNFHRNLIRRSFFKAHKSTTLENLPLELQVLQWSYDLTIIRWVWYHLWYHSISWLVEGPVHCTKWSLYRGSCYWNNIQIFLSKGFLSALSALHLPQLTIDFIKNVKEFKSPSTASVLRVWKLLQKWMTSVDMLTCYQNGF